MSTETAKPKLTFAKVAASGNVRPPAIARGSNVPTASSNTASIKQSELARGEETTKGLAPVEDGTDVDKYTPRQTKSTLASSFVAGQNTISARSAMVSSGEPCQSVPVSEENVTMLPSMRPPPSSLSQDGKSTTSGTTFPLDEKESLRPDDSASVQAGEEDDGRGSTQPSSRIGSDSGARAFSEQLREISVMGLPPRQPAVLARMNSANAANAGVLYAPSPIPVPNTLNGVSATLSGEQGSLSFPPDEKLLEALSSVRDRVWVLKLEQDITDFVKDPTAQMFDLPQCNSFYRMLAHKMADYYLLGHTMDASLSTVRLWKTPNCRIPPRLSDITGPSTAASTPPPPMPQMKILRRSENGTRPSSREGGGDGDSESDLGKNKFPATREEREARYEAARLRILGSAKPNEETPTAAAPPRDKDESNASSVVGKRKNRKQRTDSEDGFEARSAYSMYAPGTVTQMPPQKPQGYQQAESMPFQHAQPMAYGAPPAYGNGYTPPMDMMQVQQPWYPQQYPQMPQPQQTWPQDQYGSYDMAGHMQGMSMQQPAMNPSYPSALGSSGSPHYGSPGHMQAYPVYSPPQPYTDQYAGPFPQQPQQQYQNSQPYPYGMLPAHVQAGKRQNPNHPLPGSFNRQYFNPQSQAFVPTASGSPYRQSYPAPFSPAMSHASAYGGPQHLQRQHSSQSNSHVHHQPQTLTQPNPQSLTHPLPQPVFMASPGNKASPSSQNGSLPRESSIAKFAAPSLPAKPPPPISDAVRFSPAHLSGTEMNGHGRKTSPRA
ncbi:cAMP-regulated phosphoprotein 21 [Sphaceloma murrayae]|uniref:cAMP-regulated phosphoprotein 21 n=1 Tax=Sphaceloma murrayae TaxID=2082308 RepID=A0A2K1QGS1_9PEZI|nr:cAMP-regulated phosphoprotein 21 [Sphaceloma murrayae]